MELSIIITVYDKAELLELCINSIRDSVGKGLNYEIIVAESESRESVRDLMRDKFPEVRFITNKRNVGFGVVANQGIRKAKGKYFFVINHDIIIKPGAIEGLLRFLKDNKDVGLVAPRLINFDGTVQSSAYRFYKIRTVVYRRTFLKRFWFAKKHLRDFLLQDELSKKDVIDVDWVMGSAMMVSAEAVKKIGLFDEKFFMYFEDVDWCWRFWQAGYRVVYNKKITVAHYHGKASENKSVLQALLLNKFTRIHIRSFVYFFVKHFKERIPHFE